MSADILLTMRPAQDQVTTTEGCTPNDHNGTSYPTPQGSVAWPWPSSDLVLGNRYGDEDTTLLMYYLDKVFYVQFPFYDPSTIDGGRGWLLRLLTRRKSIYHATLALSKLHRDLILPWESYKTIQSDFVRPREEYFIYSKTSL